MDSKVALRFCLENIDLGCRNLSNLTKAQFYLNSCNEVLTFVAEKDKVLVHAGLTFLDMRIKAQGNK